MSDDRNPLIGVVGPADTMNQCAQVLQVVELATGSNEDAYNLEDAQMGYHLILTAVRKALMWEAEHFNERTKPTEPKGNVSQLLQGG